VKLKQFLISAFLSGVFLLTLAAPYAEAYSRRGSNDFSVVFGPLLIVILVWIVLILICREVYCWYTKINYRIQIHHEQTELLKSICSAVGGKLPEKKS
jgi:hypothetical protein